MGFLDRLLGREPARPQQEASGQQPYGQQSYGQQQAQGQQQGQGGGPRRSEDEIAVERYRYLLRTAPP